MMRAFQVQCRAQIPLCLVQETGARSDEVRTIRCMMLAVAFTVCKQGVVEGMMLQDKVGVQYSSKNG
jgi:hypothetical protein